MELIPGIQSFFEVFNYYAELLFEYFSGVHTFFLYISTGVQLLYQLVGIMPGWMQGFGLMTIAYYVIVFVLHPE